MNENIEKLTDALIEALGAGTLTSPNLRQTITLAYNIGKNDGSLETCDKFLKPLEAAA